MYWGLAKIITAGSTIAVSTAAGNTVQIVGSEKYDWQLR